MEHKSYLSQVRAASSMLRWYKGFMIAYLSFFGLAVLGFVILAIAGRFPDWDWEDAWKVSLLPLAVVTIALVHLIAFPAVRKGMSTEKSPRMLSLKMAGVGLLMLLMMMVSVLLVFVVTIEIFYLFGLLPG